MKSRLQGAPTIFRLIVGAPLPIFFWGCGRDPFRYDYQAKGIVQLNVQSNGSEWAKCQTLAEAILSTLHIPE